MWLLSPPTSISQIKYSCKEEQGIESWLPLKRNLSCKWKSKVDSTKIVLNFPKISSSIYNSFKQSKPITYLRIVAGTPTQCISYFVILAGLLLDRKCELLQKFDPPRMHVVHCFLRVENLRGVMVTKQNKLFEPSNVTNVLEPEQKYKIQVISCPHLPGLAAFSLKISTCQFSRNNTIPMH